MNYMIKKIKMGKSNAYLVRAKKGYILVDAGMENKLNKVKDTLNEINADWEDIILIIITHVHYDHVGSLFDLKERTKAEVLVHEKEKKLLEMGKTSFPKGTMILSKMISKLGNLFLQGSFKPVVADITINDCYELSKYGINGKIIYTPGHTEGSISLIIENNIICGDTFFGVLPNSVYPPFANNKEQLLKSWKKISKYDCENFYPGHGEVFNRKKFIRSLNKII